MFKIEDLNKTAKNMHFNETGYDPMDWVDNNDIDVNALANLVTLSVEVFAEKVNRGIPPEDAITDAILNSFALGWESYKQNRVKSPFEHIEP